MRCNKNNGKSTGCYFCQRFCAYVSKTASGLYIPFPFSLRQIKLPFSPEIHFVWVKFLLCLHMKKFKKTKTAIKKGRITSFLLLRNFPGMKGPCDLGTELYRICSVLCTIHCTYVKLKNCKMYFLLRKVIRLCT
jgi:hypothetical protein